MNFPITHILLQYYGKLGAGKSDAYGTVEVKDRLFYCNWFYKLVTALFEIKMTNNDVSGTSRLKFIARNNIEILSGDYYTFFIVKVFS